jgi:poly(beta-D-mannuronate) lyase
VGNSWSSQLPSYSIIEENIFYHCDGENEIISVKSGFNTVRRNLFYESRGGLVCRHGHNNIIDSNVIIGNQLPGTSGIRIINQGHTVCNNYVEGVTGKGSSAAFILRMGVYERPSAPEDYEDEKLKSYHRAANIDIAFNTFVDCAELNFGDGQGDKEPQNVRFAHNRIYSPNTFPNIKINNPAIFPGTTFVDNLCQFKSKESPAIKGFQSITFNKEQIKAQRRQAVSPADCGTTWHSTELNEIDTLTGLMQQ